MHAVREQAVTRQTLRGVIRRQFRAIAEEEHEVAPARTRPLAIESLRLVTIEVRGRPSGRQKLGHELRIEKRAGKVDFCLCGIRGPSIFCGHPWDVGRRAFPAPALHHSLENLWRFEELSIRRVADLVERIPLE